MSVDGDQTTALVQKASASSVGALFMAFSAAHLLVLEEASVVIAGLTLALISAACICFAACRTALEPACLTAEVCGPCRPGFSGPQLGIRHVYAEISTPALRRFRSVRRSMSFRLLSPGR
jgi:hypothetical protein